VAPTLPIITRLLPDRNGSAVEEVTDLLKNPAFRLEHLVSHGQASPVGFWYDQPQEEWVVLLRGTASLVFVEGDSVVGTLDLVAGDSLTIPAHQRHRVETVSDDAVWIALHFNRHDKPENVA
jgi:cupin 2 domain-containing protein